MIVTRALPTWRLFVSLALFSIGALGGCDCGDDALPLDPEDVGVETGDDSAPRRDASNSSRDGGAERDGGGDAAGTVPDSGGGSSDRSDPGDGEASDLDGTNGEGDGAIPANDGAATGDGAVTPGDDAGAGNGDAGADGAILADDGGKSFGDGGALGGDGASPGGDGGGVGSDGSIAGDDGGAGGMDGAGGGADGGLFADDSGSSGSDASAAGADASAGGDDGASSGDASAGADGESSDGGGLGGTDAEDDGGLASDASEATDGPSDDGSTGGGADSGQTDSGSSDAGNPDGSVDSGALGQPLSDFCQGAGGVVEIGSGGQCAGTVAQQTFRFGVCTCQSMVLPSNLSVDAFDSRLGAYGASTPSGPNIREDGHVGVNGQLNVSGMVDVLGSVFVSGGGFSVGQQSSISINVYAADDAVQTNSKTTVGRNMFINGDVSGRYDVGQDLYVPVGASVSQQTLSNVLGQVIFGPIPAVEPCPCDVAEILDIQALTQWGSVFNDNLEANLDETTWASGIGPDTITLPCGRYYLTRIDHPRGITIRAEGRTVLYVDGDVILGGGLRLELAPGAEMDVFIAGSLSLQSASRLGSEDRPSAVRTYVGGITPIVLSANTLFGGNLYAPYADVTFGASANLYGALFAKNALFSGSTEVHFDSAIRAAGQSCAPDAGPADGGAAEAGVNDAGAQTGDAAADGGVDAGVDAGSADSGVAPDAGQTCTQCFECGTQACIFPQDAPGPGTCGPCSSDLDCCPTEVCDPVTMECQPTL